MLEIGEEILNPIRLVNILTITRVSYRRKLLPKMITITNSSIIDPNLRVNITKFIY